MLQVTQTTSLLYFLYGGTYNSDSPNLLTPCSYFFVLVHSPVFVTISIFYSSFHFLPYWTIYNFAARQHFLPLLLFLLSCCGQCLFLMFFILSFTSSNTWITHDIHASTSCFFSSIYINEYFTLMYGRILLRIIQMFSLLPSL